MLVEDLQADEQAEDNQNYDALAKEDSLVITPENQGSEKKKGFFEELFCRKGYHEQNEDDFRD
jgi:hypothetical protein